jgi:hypothetical protein
MRITGILLRKSTPVFKVEASEDSYFARVWGGVYSGGSWLYPAYFPFAKWVFEDIRKFYPQAEWDTSALEFLRDVREANKRWTDVERQWAPNKLSPRPGPTTTSPQILRRISTSGTAFIGSRSGGAASFCGRWAPERRERRSTLSAFFATRGTFEKLW